MLIYQPTEVLKTTLTTTNHSGDESHMMKQSSSQAAFPQTERFKGTVHFKINF